MNKKIQNIIHSLHHKDICQRISMWIKVGQDQTQSAILILIAIFAPITLPHQYNFLTELLLHYQSPSDSPQIRIEQGQRQVSINQKQKIVFNLKEMYNLLSQLKQRYMNSIFEWRLNVIENKIFCNNKFKCQLQIESEVFLFNQKFVVRLAQNQINYPQIFDFIPALKYQILIEKASYLQTKIFQPIIQLDFLKYNPQIGKQLLKWIKNFGSSQNLYNQFIIIRRIYYIWNISQLKQILVRKYTLITSLQQINNSQIPKKQPAMFLYHLINTQEYAFLKDQDSLSNLLQSSYCTVKALSYINDEDIVYSLTDFKKKGRKKQVQIQAGDTFTEIFIVRKGTSIFYWNVQVENYDIQFMITRVDNSIYNQENYHQIFKARFQKQNGNLLLKKGKFKMVFNNSFSYLRSKNVNYNFGLLQPV